MASRLQLHEELCELLGSRNVYFQPPASVTMQYDAIRYSESEPDVQRANNGVYTVTARYDGVIITRDPDSPLPMKLLQHFRMCELGRGYSKDNLYHKPFTIYY